MKTDDVTIAYICLCHTDPAFIGRLSRALQYKDDALFIHVDRKVDIEPFIQSCSGSGNTVFVPDRVEVHWGGFSSVVATVQAFKLAMKTGHYDRFVLLQGQDYPLFSPKKIHDFFIQNSSVEFCRANDISVSTRKKVYMCCCGYWMYDQKNNPLMRPITNIVHEFNRRFGIKYRPAVFSCRGQEWHMYKGWAHFALTGSCVAYLIQCFDQMDDYNTFMKHRFPPDEIYFHTLVHNSAFRDKVSDKVIINREGQETVLNLTYFEYPPGAVTVFREEQDYDWLIKTGCLFVRKVNSSSAPLLDRIERSFSEPGQV